MNDNIHSQTSFSELWDLPSNRHVAHTVYHKITSVITGPTQIRHSTCSKTTQFLSTAG